MHEITKDQIRTAQTLASKKFHDREERIAAMCNFFGEDITSTKDLTQIQADDWIYWLREGKHPDNFSWGRFNKNNKRHRTVLSLCLQLGWNNAQYPQYADLNRLGSFLKSKKSPMQKPLRDMSPQECSKIISALESMLKKKYK